MSETILFVDDDKAILDYARDLFLAQGGRVLTAVSGEEALELLQQEPVAVLVTDNQMPGICGLDLIARANETSPDTVKIMTTAYANLSVALSAINRCEVFRFILKPWKGEEMIKTVKDGLRRFRTMQTIRKENEDILCSLAQTIELKDPDTRGHCDRVADYAVQMATALNLSLAMQREIRYGSWLHDCGKIGVPEHLLNARRQLDEDEFRLMQNHSAWGADVAAKAHLSAAVVNVIMYHHERFDGRGYPSGLEGSNIPVEARIVAVADVFDALSSDRPYRPRFPEEKVIEIIQSMKGVELDPDIVDVFLSLLAVRHATG